MNDSRGGQAGVPPAWGPGGEADAAERRRGWQDERAGSLGTGSAYRPAVRPRAVRGAETKLAWVPRPDGRSARPGAPAARLVTSWAAALAVWFLGVLVTARLTPPPGVGGVPVSELGDALRVHVPCLVTSVLCVVVAGFYQRGTGPFRMIAPASVPPLAASGGVIIGFPVAAPGPAALVYVTGSVLGAALGLLIANWFGDGDGNR
ncbi:hypothetical protein [Actinomadura sp. NBRC 104412]|uniref:hypothetical protein n=1 Tax=Actinomadura sp. NBRC 104412 TaxID=3032203 RepID=UPI0025537DD8|nr:hypothetical protein [Actinomadura sp. NBRC 104412]